MSYRILKYNTAVTAEVSLGYITFMSRQTFLRILNSYKITLFTFQKSGAQIELKRKKQNIALWGKASVQQKTDFPSCTNNLSGWNTEQKVF